MKRSQILLVLPLVLALARCAPSSSPDEGIGRVAIPLSNTGSDGLLYTVHDATLSITGAEEHMISDTSSAEVLMDLTAGSYEIELGGEWYVTRETDGEPEEIGVVLVSRNPQAFKVSEGQTTVVTFNFVVADRDGALRTMVTFDEGHWLAGNFTITDNPDTGNSTDYFDPIEGVSTDFVIYFAIESQDKIGSGGGYEQAVDIHTGPVSLTFPGSSDPNLAALASSLSGSTMVMRLIASGSYVSMSSAAIHSDDFSVILSAEEADVPVDAEGFPVLEPFTTESGQMLLRRWGDISGISDQATGASTLDFD
jgi:hypothetical protein